MAASLLPVTSANFTPRCQMWNVGSACGGRVGRGWGPGCVGAPRAAPAQAEWVRAQSAHTRSAPVCASPPPCWEPGSARDGPGGGGGSVGRARGGTHPDAEARCKARRERVAVELCEHGAPGILSRHLLEPRLRRGRRVQGYVGVRALVPARAQGRPAARRGERPSSMLRWAPGGAELRLAPRSPCTGRSSCCSSLPALAGRCCAPGPPRCRGRSSTPGARRRVVAGPMIGGARAQLRQLQRAGSGGYTGTCRQIM